MQSAPRLILLDLDGTLVGSDGHVSARNRAALTRAVDAGSRVVIATGRPAHILFPLSESLPDCIAICYNGAAVIDLAGCRVLATRVLDGEAFRRAVETMRAEGLSFGVIVEGGPDAGPRGEPGVRENYAMPRESLAELCATEILKALLIVDDEQQFLEVWRAFSTRFADTLQLTRSGVAGLIEVSARGISKGSAVAELAIGWGIDASEAIAFGDMPNDLEMFHWAGWAVAMGNAEPEVKLAASEVTLHHDEDGVADILERWF